MCQLGKPTLGVVDPRRRCGREMDVPVGTARQPGSDPRRLVRGVVVYRECTSSLCRIAASNCLRQSKLGCAVSLVALPNDRPCGDVECGELRGRAIANVAMGAPLRNARRQRQDRLLAVESLIWDFSSTHNTIVRFGGERGALWRRTRVLRKARSSAFNTHCIRHPTRHRTTSSNRQDNDTDHGSR